MEEQELKIVHKDKWPIPLSSTTFTKQGAPLQQETQSKSLYFGSVYPVLVINEAQPIHFELGNCQYESLEMRDPLFVYDFIQSNLLTQESKQDRYSDKELHTVGWPVSTEGEFIDQPFALLKPSKRQVQGAAMSREQIERAVKDLELNAIQLPYSLTLCIMPLNFVEFWKLI